jgi:GPH family glycoside/pentoside/hexuronide:cation symporter
MADRAAEEKPVFQPKPFSRSLKTFYGVGDMTFGWLGSVENYYWNYFLTNVAQFSLSVTTVVAMVVTAVDIPLSPLWGGLLNSIKPGKHGRYRTWLVKTPWVLMILYPFMFMRIGNEAVAAVLIVIAAIASHVAYAFPWNANMILVSVVGRTPEGRATLAGTRATWSSLSRIAFSYGAPALVAILIGRIGPNYGYGGFAFITAMLWTLGYLVNFLVTSGYEEIEAPTVSKHESKTKASGKDMAKALFQNPNLIALMGSMFPRYLFGSVQSAGALYYFNYVAHNPGLMAPYMLISAIGATLGSSVSGRVMRKLGARNCAILGFGVVGTTCLLAFLFYRNPWAVIGWLTLSFMANGMMTACETAMYADAAVYSQWKLGADARGWVMGLSVFPIKLSFVIRSLILNLVLALVGFSAAIPASEATVELQRGISMVFLVIPGVLVLVAMFVIIFGYRITKEKIAQYQEEIAARGGK